MDAETFECDAEAFLAVWDKSPPATTFPFDRKYRMTGEIANVTQPESGDATVFLKAGGEKRIALRFDQLGLIEDSLEGAAEKELREKEKRAAEKGSEPGWGRDDAPAPHEPVHVPANLPGLEPGTKLTATCEFKGKKQAGVVTFERCSRKK